MTKRTPNADSSDGTLPQPFVHFMFSHMSDSEKEAERCVPAAFHVMRKEAKRRNKAKQGADMLHHRAATDWWNFVKR